MNPTLSRLHFTTQRRLDNDVITGYMHMAYCSCRFLQPASTSPHVINKCKCSNWNATWSHDFRRMANLLWLQPKRMKFYRCRCKKGNTEGKHNSQEMGQVFSSNAWNNQCPTGFPFRCSWKYQRSPEFSEWASVSSFWPALEFRWTRINENSNFVYGSMIKACYSLLCGAWAVQ